MPHFTALVMLLAVVVYFITGLRVGKARVQYGIAAPATTGNSDFERIFRVQMNTLEWMPIFLPLLWLFAIYVGDTWAAVLGLIWIAERVLYMTGYTETAAKRGAGFGVQAVAAGVLFVGSAVGIVYRLSTGG